MAPTIGPKVAGTLEIDTSRIGQIDGQTLVDALRCLQKTAGQPVALIIDAAQHALTGELGMTALKSTRDQMNKPGQVDMMLVMSGSDRNKLVRMVVSAEAPFYDSQIQAMPPLDTDFIAHVADLVEAQRTDLVPVDRAALQEVFTAFGYWPQFFTAAMGAVLSPLSGRSGRFEPALQEAARDQQVQHEAQMESDYMGLKLRHGARDIRDTSRPTSPAANAPGRVRPGDRAPHLMGRRKTARWRELATAHG